MLKATIDAEIFRESIDAIAALVTECRVHTQEDMIWTRSVDTANVAMVTLELQSTAFTSFSATGGELGLDVAKLKNILAMIGKGDALTLQLQDNDRKLELSFGGYRYSITLLDVNTIRKDPNPPAVNLPGKAVIPGETLNNAIKAASVISDKIALGIDPESMTFYMEAEGDTDHIKLALSEDELIALNPVKARSLFSIDYLKDMGRVMARAEKVEIHLSINHPVRFVFEIADGNGRVDYLLAPRVEAD